MGKNLEVGIKPRYICSTEAVLHRATKTKKTMDSFYDACGLLAIPATEKDVAAILDYLETSDFFAHFDEAKQVFLFPETEGGLDELERLLGIDFEDEGINARFEANL